MRRSKDVVLGQTRGVSRRAFLQSASIALLAGGGITGLAGCAADPANPNQRGSGTIRIGSAMFPESEIIARIWARTLEIAGYSVTVVPQIGARDVYLAALQEGSIDLVPEYIGNAAAYWGEVPVGASSEQVFRSLKANMPDEFEALTPASAESKDAYRMLRSVAEEHGIKSLADLSKLSSISIGGSPELAQRPYGPKGLTQFYGVAPESMKMVVYGDSGGPLTIRAIHDGVVTIADVYTTTPLWDTSGEKVDVVTLEDPKNMIAAQNVVPIARRGVLDAGAQEALAKVSARLTTQDLIAMNERASGEEKAGAELIARDWLKERLATSR